MALNSFKKASIHVDGPGMYTTIQDAGRVGYQQYGMPVAGPMDSESYLLGQALVGNTTPFGALECTVLPPTLTVQGTCIVAFTGADMHPTINNVVVPRYIPLYVTKAISFLAALANVACACILPSQVVLMFPLLTVAYRLIQRLR